MGVGGVKGWGRGPAGVGGQVFTSVHKTQLFTMHRERGWRGFHAARDRLGHGGCRRSGGSKKVSSLFAELDSLLAAWQVTSDLPALARIYLEYLLLPRR